MMKLALHGARFSGKSTLARALEARGWQWLNYTDLIKEMLCEALAAIGITLTVEQIHENKEFYRNLIIEFATVAGFDDGFGVDRMLASIRPDAEGVVFDNVRFLPQWEMLEKEGFTLVRLTTQDHFREARGRAVGVTRDELRLAALRSTETPLPEQPGEIRLHQVGAIEDVLNDLTALLAEKAAPVAEVELTGKTSKKSK